MAVEYDGEKTEPRLADDLFVLQQEVNVRSARLQYDLRSGKQAASGSADAAASGPVGLDTDGLPVGTMGFFHHVAPPTPADLAWLEKSMPWLSGAERMGTVRFEGWPGDPEEGEYRLVDLGSRLAHSGGVRENSCLLLHAAAGLERAPDSFLADCTAELRNSSLYAQSGRQRDTASNILGQVSADAAITSDMFRHLGGTLGSAAVCCYIYTPKGLRTVLYRPSEEPTLVVELLLSNQHCVLLSRGDRAATPWLEFKPRFAVLRGTEGCHAANCLTWDFDRWSKVGEDEIEYVSQLGDWLQWDNSEAVIEDLDLHLSTGDELALSLSISHEARSATPFSVRRATFAGKSKNPTKRAAQQVAQQRVRLAAEADLAEGKLRAREKAAKLAEAKRVREAEKRKAEQEKQLEADKALTLLEERDSTLEALKCFKAGIQPPAGNPYSMCQMDLSLRKVMMVVGVNMRSAAHLLTDGDMDWMIIIPGEFEKRLKDSLHYVLRKAWVRGQPISLDTAFVALGAPPEGPNSETRTDIGTYSQACALTRGRLQREAMQKWRSPPSALAPKSVHQQWLIDLHYSSLRDQSLKASWRPWRELAKHHLSKTRTPAPENLEISTRTLPEETTRMKAAAIFFAKVLRKYSSIRSVASPFNNWSFYTKLSASELKPSPTATAPQWTVKGRELAELTDGELLNLSFGERFGIGVLWEVDTFGLPGDLPGVVDRVGEFVGESYDQDYIQAVTLAGGATWKIWLTFVCQMGVIFEVVTTCAIEICGLAQLDTKRREMLVRETVKTLTGWKGESDHSFAPLTFRKGDIGYGSKIPQDQPGQPSLNTFDRLKWVISDISKGCECIHDVICRATWWQACREEWSFWIDHTLDTRVPQYRGARAGRWWLGGAFNTPWDRRSRLLKFLDTQF